MKRENKNKGQLYILIQASGVGANAVLGEVKVTVSEL